MSERVKRKPKYFGEYLIDDLTIDTCHYPIGYWPPYKYCGRQTVDVEKRTAIGSSTCRSAWCELHFNIVHRRIPR